MKPSDELVAAAVPFSTVPFTAVSFRASTLPFKVPFKARVELPSSSVAFSVASAMKLSAMASKSCSRAAAAAATRGRSCAGGATPCGIS